MSVPDQQIIELQYFNRPEVQEVFADHLERMTVDGATNTLRMEFTVTRMDDPLPGQNKQIGRKYTVARIVLPMPGLLDMINKFQQVTSVMEQQGTLKRQLVVTPPAGGKPN
jgi:hypothetical protein